MTKDKFAQTSYDDLKSFIEGKLKGDIGKSEIDSSILKLKSVLHNKAQTRDGDQNIIKELITLYSNNDSDTGKKNMCAAMIRECITHDQSLVENLSLQDRLSLLDIKDENIQTELNKIKFIEASLNQAIDKGDIKITQVLLEALDQKKNTLNTTYKDASYQNQGVIAREILQINRHITQALLVAIEQENINLVNALLEKGANPHAKDQNHLTPLFIAAEKGNIELTKALLEKGADPNAQGVLLEAASRNRTEIVKILLEKGANPNADNMGSGVYGKTPLIEAVRNRQPEIVKALLEKGADPNAKNYLKISALASDTSPEIKSMLEEASSMQQKLDRKATKHIQSALKEVSKNKDQSLDDIFADKKVHKHISPDSFTDQAKAIQEGRIKLTFVEKVKSVFQGRDEVVSQKAMKQLKESLQQDAGYKELIAAKVEARHDKQQQRQYDMMKEFMPSSTGQFIQSFLDYSNKGTPPKIIPASEKDIQEESRIVAEGITDDIQKTSQKSLSPKEQKTLESNLVKAYQQLALEIRQNIPAEKLNTQQPDASEVVIRATKGSSFAKAMKDIEGGKKPELPKGSAAALFVEAIKPLTRSTFKEKVTAENTEKNNQKGR